MFKNNRKQKLANRLIYTTCFLAMALGVVLIIRSPFAHSHMSSNTNKYLPFHYTADDLAKNKEKDADFDWNNVHSLDPNAALAAPNTDLPVIAGISIPQLNINLPIFKGLAEENLTYGAGTMKKHQEMGKGNYTLASHHVTSPYGSSPLLFTPLDYAEKGIVIYLTDLKDVYSYVIYDAYIVDPDDSYVVDDPAENETPIITLVTCTDVHATKRIIVQGKFTGKKAWDQVPDDIKASFNVEYNRYQL